ncbi:MAG: hypothetical protein J5636_03470 [Clostridiales bacterium]|nr:hypothetical protein [Clostridiales bacterium]
MYISLLMVAAFLFFLADRKIRWSSLLGMFTTVLACLPLAHDVIFFTTDTMFFYQGILKKLGFRANHVNMDRFRIILAAFLSLALILILMVIAKLWSRELLPPEQDGIRYERITRALLIVASGIILLVELWLFTNESLFPNNPYVASEVRYYNWILLLGRTSIYHSGKMILYGVALLLVAVLPLTLIICKKLSFKKCTPLHTEEISISTIGSKLSTVGITISLLAILCFTTIAATAYPRNKHLRLLFYDHQHLHHDYSTILCTIVLLSLLTGAVLLILGLIRIAKGKTIRKCAFTFVFSIVLTVISLGDFLFLLRDAIRFFS